MVEIRINIDTSMLRKQFIEGPTVRQARKMARIRQEWLAQARELVATGRKEDQLAALELDCSAWEIEADLNGYGFDPETGTKK